MNDVDTLMSRIGVINAKSARECTDADIDDLIRYYRQQRARRAAGEKVERPVRAAVDVVSLLNLSPTKPSGLPTITRRL